MDKTDKEKAPTIETQMENELTKMTRAEMLNMFHLLATYLGFHVIMEKENAPPQDKGPKIE